ncbi:hypothetical protein J6590_024716 [Homalodisca vitripennis]|nr:hypothetical protein J6590_024716 [Homalodisca vitripennis]
MKCMSCRTPYGCLVGSSQHRLCDYRIIGSFWTFKDFGFYQMANDEEFDICLSEYVELEINGTVMCINRVVGSLAGERDTAVLAPSQVTPRRPAAVSAQLMDASC